MANQVNCYITNSHGNRVALPVAPSDISINYETNDSSSVVIGKGEINRVGDFKLRKITINSILPINSDKVAYTTVAKKHRWVNATSYLTFLKNIEQSQTTCRLVLTGTDITMSANLKISYGMASGNAQEYTIQLSFTEHIPVKARKIGRKNKKITKKGKSRSKPTHKLSRGSKVLVNGTAYLTNNAKKGVMIRKRECRIKIISKKAKHPYYVQATNGVNIGWVARSAIK